MPTHSPEQTYCSGSVTPGPVIDIVGWYTHRPTPPAPAGRSYMQPARCGGSSVGMMGLLQPGVPGFHAPRGVVCIYIMRQIYIPFHKNQCCIQQLEYLSQFN